jgi:hypothetical protein
MYLVSGVIIIALLAGGYFYLYDKTPKSQLASPTVTTSPTASPKEVDITASFGIFTNGTFRIFTPARYHNQSEDIYIEASNPYIIHVKKENLTWADFFKTLPMKLEKDCILTGTKETFCTNSEKSLKFYINGNSDPTALNRSINQGDQLLVSYGNENESQIQAQLQKTVSIK